MAVEVASKQFVDSPDFSQTAWKSHSDNINSLELKTLWNKGNLLKSHSDHQHHRTVCSNSPIKGILVFVQDIPGLERNHSAAHCGQQQALLLQHPQVTISQKLESPEFKDGLDTSQCSFQACRVTVEVRHILCDTCCTGFETDKTPYIAGARVRIECKDRKTDGLKYSIEGVTSSTGIYNIEVSGEHGDEMCDVKVVTPQPDCATPSSGCDYACVIITRYNSIVPDTRNVNSIAFQRDQPMAGCTELLKTYMVDEDQ
ncbi:uncharacterized protein LOC132268451 [Cornus florida]|uniref:uncharacterized protein LOC132268451 n=1 Tax=Cornus florida TaxID=4283 RepID=UPI002896C996|nr:uncharacterized protein LOC132268451 [Cornus florida]